MLNENQIKGLKVAFAAFGITLCIMAAIKLAGRNDVFNFGNGVEHVRDELADAEESQSRAAESLSRASELAESAAGRADEIAARNRDLQNSERGDEEIIRESEQILERVRARGEA